MLSRRTQPRACCVGELSRRRVELEFSRGRAELERLSWAVAVMGTSRVKTVRNRRLRRTSKELADW